MDLPIEKAKIEDYKPILDLYRTATALHRSMGIIQWDDEYPSSETLKENLEAGSTWISRIDGRIAATMTLDEDQDPQYENIQWAFPAEKILVLHRLCVDPSLQGHGLAKKFVAFAELFALEYGYGAIRLDAFLGNPYSQRLYRGLGYHEATGYCYYLPDWIMCNCFEKRIIL